MVSSIQLYFKNKQYQAAIQACRDSIESIFMTPLPCDPVTVFRIIGNYPPTVFTASSSTAG